MLWTWTCQSVSMIELSLSHSWDRVLFVSGTNSRVLCFCKSVLFLYFEFFKSSETPSLGTLFSDSEQLLS